MCCAIIEGSVCFSALQLETVDLLLKPLLRLLVMYLLTTGVFLKNNNNLQTTKTVPNLHHRGDAN
jgi:hypothetical protein